MFKYLKNSIWIIGDKLAQIVSALLVGVLIARHLGPEAYGVLSLALALTALIKPLCAFGLDQVLIKRIISSSNQQDTISSEINLYIRIKTLIAVVVLCSLAIIILLIPHKDEALLICLIITTPLIFQAADYLEPICQLKAKSKLILKTRTLQLCLSAGIKLALVSIGSDLKTIALAYSADYLLTYAIYIILIRQQSPYNSAKPSRNSISKTKEILKSAFPIAITTLSINAYMKLDIVMLSYLKGSQEAGLYTAASKIPEVMTFIPLAIVTGVFPFLAKIREKDTAFYSSAVSVIGFFFLVSSCIFSLAVFSSSESIITLLFGNEFILAAAPLMILCFSSIPLFIGINIRRVAVLEGAQSISMKITLISLLVNIALNFLLIPTYGMQGAASATLATRILGSVALYGVFQQTRWIFSTSISSINPIIFFKNIELILKKR